MSEKINIGGEILVELKRKNGKREIFKHNMMTEFGRSFALSQGINKLRYSTSKNKGTLGVIGIGNANNTINPLGVGAIPPTANPASSGGVDQTASKLCNLLMNISSGTITKKKACFMPESANLLAYAFRDTASAANEGYIDWTGDNIAFKNRVVTRYVYPSDLAGQFNCIAMSTMTPDTTYKGRAAKVQRSIARILSSSNSMPNYILYDGTYLYLYPSDLGKVNLETGEVTDHSYTVYSDFFTYPDTSSGHYATYFTYNGFPMQIYYQYSSSASNSYLYVNCKAANGTIQQWSTRLYGLGFRGAFFKNGSLYVSFQYGSTYKVTVDSTTGAMTYATTSDDVSDLLDKAYLPLDENNYIDVNWKFNGMKVPNPGIYFIHDNKLLSFAKPDLYSLSWNIGYNGTSQSSAENLLTEYGNILSFHQYDNPIVKNVGDELSVTYSYYMS